MTLKSLVLKRLLHYRFNLLDGGFFLEVATRGTLEYLDVKQGRNGHNVLKEGRLYALILHPHRGAREGVNLEWHTRV